MNFTPGDTLFFKDHLCVVISDPAQDPNRVVVVAFTTRESWTDEGCVLYPGDHPFIQHDTCIDYAFFNPCLTLRQLQNAISSNMASRPTAC